MNFNILLAIILYFISWVPLAAQQILIEGTVIDRVDRTGLPGATISIYSQEDSTIQSNTSANQDGDFSMIISQGGKKTIKIEYYGYETIRKLVNLIDGKNVLDTFQMTTSVYQLNAVEIRGNQVIARQKNDTTEFNANAFKTNPDANAEDLIRKMPGVSVENGNVKAHGENINKVLVDGKEFFGDDASLALQNLPSDAIDKIQIFDRISDQAQYSGFDDGNTQKTINIVTKSGKVEGNFGKVYGGTGTSGRYAAGGNLNHFKGSQRISVLGMINNVNQQNFSGEDLAGINLGKSKQSESAMGGGNRSGRNGYNPNNASNNFLTSQQNGINTTKSAGINYSNNFSKKVNITASYFYNRILNFNENNTERNYLLNGGENQIYNEVTNGENTNNNHRSSARIEYNIDSSNSILITPKFSLQNNAGNKIFSGSTSESENIILNQTRSANNSQTNAYHFSNAILYNHKFKKKGRSFALNINNNINHRNGLTFLNGSTNNNDTLLRNFVHQKTDIETDIFSIGANISYTEPVNEKSKLIFTYAPSINNNNSVRMTYSTRNENVHYDSISRQLSNDYKTNVNTNQAGMGYNFKDNKATLSVVGNVLVNVLEGNQYFPLQSDTKKKFIAFLPGLRFQYKFENNSNLRILYRTSANIPSVTQLQDVIDNSNPLQLSRGNPSLNQEISHTVYSRFSGNNVSKGRNINLFISISAIQNYIGNALIVADSTFAINEVIYLPKGGQLSTLKNFKNNLSFASNISYGKFLNSIKSNINLNAGINLSNIPGEINNKNNKTNYYTLNTGLGLSSNINPMIDFTFNYSGYFNMVQNNLQSDNNNNFYNQTILFKMNVMPWKGLVLASDLNNVWYTGLGEAFNRNFFLWNPSIGYKFLKNRAAELRLSAFDILNQNNSISRMVTSNYTEDVRTIVLKRYFMLSFIYTLRNSPQLSKGEEEAK